MAQLPKPVNLDECRLLGITPDFIVKVRKEIALADKAVRELVNSEPERYRSVLYNRRPNRSRVGVYTYNRKKIMDEAMIALKESGRYVIELDGVPDDHARNMLYKTGEKLRRFVSTKKVGNEMIGTVYQATKGGDTMSEQEQGSESPAEEPQAPAEDDSAGDVPAPTEGDE